MVMAQDAVNTTPANTKQLSTIFYTPPFLFCFAFPYFSFLVTTSNQSSSFTDTDFYFPGMCQTFRQERIWIE
jgi:hypothetical protein